MITLYYCEVRLVLMLNLPDDQGECLECPLISNESGGVITLSFIPHMCSSLKELRAYLYNLIAFVPCKATNWA